MIRTRARTGMTRERGAAVRTWIRATCEDGHLFEWRRLPNPQHDELDQLVEKLQTDDGGLDRRGLNRREWRRFEELLAVGCGHEADHFAKKRQQEKVLAKFRQLDELARRQQPLKPKQTGDLLQVLHQQLASGHLFLTHVGLVVYVLAVMRTGKPLGPMQSLEGSGDDTVLILDHSWGLIPGAIDGFEAFGSWKPQLEWLAENEWLTLQKKGPKWRIGLGAKLRVTLANGALS